MGYYEVKYTNSSGQTKSTSGRDLSKVKQRITSAGGKVVASKYVATSTKASGADRMPLSMAEKRGSDKVTYYDGTKKSKTTTSPSSSSSSQKPSAMIQNIPIQIKSDLVKLPGDQGYVPRGAITENIDVPNMPVNQYDDRTGMTATPSELSWTREGAYEDLSRGGTVEPSYEDVERHRKKNLKEVSKRGGKNVIDMKLEKKHYVGKDEEGKPQYEYESPYQVIHGYTPNDPDYASIKSGLETDISKVKSGIDSTKDNITALKENLNTIQSSPENSVWRYDLNPDKMKEEDPEGYNFIKKNFDFKDEYSSDEAVALTNYFLERNKDLLDKSKEQGLRQNYDDLQDTLFTVKQYEKLGYEVDKTEEGYEFSLPEATKVHKAVFGEHEGVALSSAAFIESPLAVKTWGSALYQWGTGDEKVGETRHRELAEYSLGLKEGLVRGDYVARIATSPAMVQGVYLPLVTMGVGTAASGISSSLSGTGGKIASTFSKWTGTLTPTGQKIVSSATAVGSTISKPFRFAGSALSTKYGSYAMIGGLYGVTEVPRIISMSEEKRAGAFAESGFTFALTLGAFKHGQKIGSGMFPPKPRTPSYRDIFGEKDLFKSHDIHLARTTSEQYYKQGLLYPDELSVSQRLKNVGGSIKNMFFEPTPKEYIMKYGTFPETSRVLGEKPITTYKRYSTRFLSGAEGRQPYGATTLQDISTAKQMQYYAIPSEYEQYWLNKNAFQLDMDVDLQIRSAGMATGKKLIMTSDAFLAGQKGTLVPQIDEAKIGSKFFMEGDRQVSSKTTELWGKYAYEKGTKYEEPFWFFKEEKTTLIPQIDEKAVGRWNLMPGEYRVVGEKPIELWGRYVYERGSKFEEPFWFFKDQKSTLLPQIDEAKIGTKYFMEGDRAVKSQKELFGRYAFYGDTPIQQNNAFYTFTPAPSTPLKTSTKFSFKSKPVGSTPSPITKTITKTVDKTPTKPIMDITKYEWYQSPLPSYIYAPKTIGTIKLTGGGYAAAYGHYNLATLEFLEEGTQYTSDYWKTQKPSISKSIKKPDVKNIFEMDAVSTPSLLTFIKTGTKKIGGLSETGAKGTTELFTIGETKFGTDIITGEKIKFGELGETKPEMTMAWDLDWETETERTPTTDIGLGLTQTQSLRQKQMQKQRLQQKQKLGLVYPFDFSIPPYKIKEPTPEPEPPTPTPTPIPVLLDDTKNDPNKRKIRRKTKLKPRIMTKGEADKGLLSDLLSVTRSQARYGTATHPKLTEKTWKEGAKTLYMRVPTKEMRQKKKKTKSKLFRRNKNVLY